MRGHVSCKVLHWLRRMQRITDRQRCQDGGVIGVVPRDGETASKSKEENYFGCIRVGDGNNLIKPSLIGKVGGAFRDNDSIEQNL